MASEQTAIQPQMLVDRPVVKIDTGNGTVFSFRASNLPLLIGRDSGCDICIPQNYISRRHCELYLEYNMVFLRDISTNGTIVDGRSIRGESVLIDGSTRIDFNGEALIHITSCSEDEKSEAKRVSSERRQDDRRKVDRRSNVIAVDFERRKGESRRVRDQRVGPRR